MTTSYHGNLKFAGGEKCCGNWKMNRCGWACMKRSKGGLRCHACNSTRSQQRNTWPELVIKCSRQFWKRVTVTVCNCRTLGGFQFGRGEDLHTLCFVCDAHTSPARYYEIRSRREISLSNVVINELRPSLGRRYEFHVSTEPLCSLMDVAREICNIVPAISVRPSASDDVE